MCVRLGSRSSRNAASPLILLQSARSVLASPASRNTPAGCRVGIAFCPGHSMSASRIEPLHFCTFALPVSAYSAVFPVGTTTTGWSSRKCARNRSSNSRLEPASIARGTFLMSEDPGAGRWGCTLVIYTSPRRIPFSSHTVSWSRPEGPTNGSPSSSSISPGASPTNTILALHWWSSGTPRGWWGQTSGMRRDIGGSAVRDQRRSRMRAGTDLRCLGARKPGTPDTPRRPP
jgi:hypothetical protein